MELSQGALVQWALVLTILLKLKPKIYAYLPRHLATETVDTLWALYYYGQRDTSVVHWD